MVSRSISFNFSHTYNLRGKGGGTTALPWSLASSSAHVALHLELPPWLTLALSLSNHTLLYFNVALRCSKVTVFHFELGVLHS